MHIGLYPLLDGDRCWWLAADFDGPDALADVLMYVKAARALQVPRPGSIRGPAATSGAHGWVFFTSPVPAEMARRPGTGEWDTYQTNEVAAWLEDCSTATRRPPT